MGRNSGEKWVAIQKELDGIRHPDGSLDVHEVLEFARTHPNSVIHQEYQWNKEKAAYAYWIEQTRRILQVLVTVTDNGYGDEISVRATFVKPKKAGEESSGYQSTAKLIKTKAGRREIAAGVIFRIESELASYPIKELQGIVRAVARAKKQLGIRADDEAVSSSLGATRTVKSRQSRRGESRPGAASPA
jgi:hypothetical protein